MSSSPTSLPTSGYAFPAPFSTSPTPPKPNATPKHKPGNVFSDDGKFLQRIQQMKEEDEKKKQEEIITQSKRDFGNRFKNRGKRRPPVDESSTTPTTEQPAKKAKTEELMNQYKKELRNYADKSLKDGGTGVRPLVK